MAQSPRDTGNYPSADAGSCADTGNYLSHSLACAVLSGLMRPAHGVLHPDCVQLCDCVSAGHVLVCREV